MKLGVTIFVALALVACKQPSPTPAGTDVALPDKSANEAVKAAAEQPRQACLGLGPRAESAGEVAGETCQLPANLAGVFDDINVANEPLGVCSKDPVTGWFRDGRCSTGPNDRGVHVVCAEMTEAFLSFTKTRGNDLSTPSPRYGFPGLKPGDRWCLCAARWQEAAEAGVAPKVALEATHAQALRLVDRQALEKHATTSDHIPK